MTARQTPDVEPDVALYIEQAFADLKSWFGSELDTKLGGLKAEFVTREVYDLESASHRAERAALAADLDKACAQISDLKSRVDWQRGVLWAVAIGVPLIAASITIGPQVIHALAK